MRLEMIRKGFRPVTMPRDMAVEVLKAVINDTSAQGTFGDRSAQPIKEFVGTLGDAISKHADPVDFWCTQLQQVYISSILGHAWVWRKCLDETTREDLKEAQRIMVKAWSWPEGPGDKAEINRGTATTLDVPEPTPERLAECGFKGIAHLERHFRRDRIPVYSFDNRSEMETYYMRGWCSVLAMAVHRRTGWPLVGVFDPWEEGYPYHVGCKAPDGTYVDARGTGQSLEEFSRVFQRWPDCPLDVREMTRDHVLSRFPLHPHYHDLAENEHLDVLLPELALEATPDLT